MTNRGIALLLLGLICLVGVVTVVAFSNDGPGQPGSTLPEDIKFELLPEPPLFRGLGFLSDTPANNDPESQGLAVSGNGKIVVGASRGDDGSLRAFSWSFGGNMTALPLAPGGNWSKAGAVSREGTVIAGSGDTSGTSEQSWIWTPVDGTVAIPLDPNYSQSRPTDMSQNGSVVVGHHMSPDMEAYRWSAAGGMESLGDLIPGPPDSLARSVSADGSVVTGDGKILIDQGGGIFLENPEAFRKETGLALEGLGDIPGCQTWSSAWAVTGDGLTIYGQTCDFVVRTWNAQDDWGSALFAPSNLTDLDISADGSIIVAAWEDVVDRAVIYEPVGGLQDMLALITSILVSAELGDQVAGWQLTEARDISDDGRVVVGTGINPAGQTEAWVFRFPSDNYQFPSPQLEKVYFEAGPLIFEPPVPGPFQRYGHALAATGDTLAIAAPGSDTVEVLDATANTLLYALEGSLGTGFGTAVLASEETLAISAPIALRPGRRYGGRVMRYRLDGRRLTTTRDPDPVTGDRFGAALAAGEGMLYIGETTAEDAPAAVYFAETSRGKITRAITDPTRAPGSFGSALAVIDNALYVGSPDARLSGQVLFYDAIRGDLLGAIENPDPEPGARFGASLAAQGNRLLVGAPGARGGTGVAYIFDRSGNLELALGNPYAEVDHGFGTVGSLGGDILVGAPGGLVGGAVYLFDGLTGNLLLREANPHPNAGDGFGSAFATTASQIHIAAPGDGPGGLDEVGVVYPSVVLPAICDSFFATGLLDFGTVAELGGVLEIDIRLVSGETLVEDEATLAAILAAEGLDMALPTIAVVEAYSGQAPSFVTPIELSPANGFWRGQLNIIETYQPGATYRLEPRIGTCPLEAADNQAFTVVFPPRR